MRRFIEPFKSGLNTFHLVHRTSGDVVLRLFRSGFLLQRHKREKTMPFDCVHRSTLVSCAFQDRVREAFNFGISLLSATHSVHKLAAVIFIKRGKRFGTRINIKERHRRFHEIWPHRDLDRGIDQRFRFCAKQCHLVRCNRYGRRVCVACQCSGRFHRAHARYHGRVSLALGHARRRGSGRGATGRIRARKRLQCARRRFRTGGRLFGRQSFVGLEGPWGRCLSGVNTR